MRRRRVLLGHARDHRPAADDPDRPQSRGRDGRDRARGRRRRARAGVEAIGIGFEARDGERYLGFGERSNAVDQRGGVVENYVSDGPYQAEEYPLINLFTPMWGLRDGHPESTYYPVPWLLSTAGYGVLADDPRTSYFRLRPTSRRVERRGRRRCRRTRPALRRPTIAGPVGFRFFAGPTPADALRRFTEATGRQPKPAAPWAAGALVSGRRRREAAELALLREADAPFSVLQTYTHYLPCGDQVGNDGEAERIARRASPPASRSPRTSTR